MELPVEKLKVNGKTYAIAHPEPDGFASIELNGEIAYFTFPKGETWQFFRTKTPLGIICASETKGDVYIQSNKDYKAYKLKVSYYKDDEDEAREIEMKHYKTNGEPFENALMEILLYCDEDGQSIWGEWPVQQMTWKEVYESLYNPDFSLQYLYDEGPAYVIYYDKYVLQREENGRYYSVSEDDLIELDKNYKLRKIK